MGRNQPSVAATSERRRLPWKLYLALLLCAVIIGSGLSWFWRHFDRAERQVLVIGSEASWRNPWLALQRFLQRTGVDVHHVSMEALWAEELPPDATLLSTSAHLSLDPERQQRLLDWLMAGGRLIIPLSGELAEDESGAVGGLVQRWKVMRHRSDREFEDEPWRFSLSADEADDAAPDADQELSTPLAEAVEDQLDAADEDWDEAWDEDAEGDEESEDPNQIKVHFLDSYYLTSDSEESTLFSMTGYDGEHILTFALGRGQVTLLSDGLALHNLEIAKHDHAWFYYQISGAAEGRPQWFSDGPLRQGLWSWLWQQSWPLWLTLGMILLLALWRANLRWGPPLPAAGSQRRHLGEHLQASAEFLWRHHQLTALWQAEIESLIQRAGAGHSELLSWPRSRQLGWILAQSTLSQAEQRFVLRCLGYGKERPLRVRAREFLQLAQLLQRLRHSYGQLRADGEQSVVPRLVDGQPEQTANTGR